MGKSGLWLIVLQSTDAVTYLRIQTNENKHYFKAWLLDTYKLPSEKYQGIGWFGKNFFDWKFGKNFFDK